MDRLYTNLRPKAKMKPYIYLPINIVIDKNNYNNNKLCLNKEEYNINSGIKILSTHFGFIISDNTSKTEKVFQTQCEISSIIQNEGVIKIYEKGKFNPWKFDLNGNIIESATFNYHDISDKSDIIVKQYKM